MYKIRKSLDGKFKVFFIIEGAVDSIASFECPREAKAFVNNQLGKYL